MFRTVIKRNSADRAGAAAPARFPFVKASLFLAMGFGFTAASEIDLWHIFPEVVQSVFSANVVAVVIVVSMVLNLILPKDMKIYKAES